MATHLLRAKRHRGYRRRSAVAAAVTFLVGLTSFVVIGRPAALAASVAVEVPKSRCVALDPNLVNGACLRYDSDSGVTRYTWIGSYRASPTEVVFCIDFLYDSRVGGSIVSTEGLLNQFGAPVGANEVAALTYLINRYASAGSTGSDVDDAAIALLMREVMSDGVTADGTVVYPTGLLVDGSVGAPAGGLDGPIVPRAQELWAEASAFRGPWTVHLAPTSTGPVPVGTSRDYDVSVTSASGRLVTGAPVSLTCTGPITCPASVTSADSPVRVSMTPSDLGTFSIRAAVTGPSANGELLVGDWSPHPGPAAVDNGVQRGWIGRREESAAVSTGTAEIVKATPTVVTTASDVHVDHTGSPIPLTDVVVVSGLPAGYSQTATAHLFGPFSARPGPQSCTPDKLVGSVPFAVDHNGTVTTPSVSATDVGYYVWTESTPGDHWTNAVETPCGAVPETTVVRAVPVMKTQASDQKVELWETVHDTIAVSGTHGVPVAIDWSLLGPVKPVNGSCAGLDWTAAAVAASGRVTAAGDGEVVTPDVRVDALGCYTYVEHAPEAERSAAADSAPGQPSETTLVIPPRRHWTLATQVSAQRVALGGSLTDTIRIDGLAHGDAVDVGWRLLGPLAPGDTGCLGLDWTTAPVAASGSLRVAGNGSVVTPPVTLHDVGCFTYAESAGATDTTAAVDSPPGQVTETALALRPPATVIPEIPSGRGAW